MLCQLVPSYRPSVWFLFIGLQVSSSLPPPGRLPFQSWLQLVIFIVFWFFHKGLSPHLQRAHAWAHTRRCTKSLTRLLTKIPWPFRNRPQSLRSPSVRDMVSFDVLKNENYRFFHFSCSSGNNYISTG